MHFRIPDANGLLWGLALLWGACAYLPVGVAYCCLALMLIALLACPGHRARLDNARFTAVLLPAGLLIGWTLFVVLVGPNYPDTWTRVFHTVRVVILVVIGLMLSASQARAALAGYLSASLVAAAIVASHHIWGLPDWPIWASLLRSRNNFSSGNMIMMALAAVVFFFMGLRNDPRWMGRGVPWLAALVLSATVAAHAESRNAQLLLPLLAVCALVFHYRSMRAAMVSAGLVILIAGLAWTFSTATQVRFAAVAQDLTNMRARSDYTTSVGVRIAMGREAWHEMLEHPATGAGVGSWLPHWRVAAERYGAGLAPSIKAHYVEINNPHNDYLLAGMETGIPGLLCLVVWMGAMLRLGWRSRSTEGGIAFLLTAGLALTAINNAPLRDAALGMTLLWLVGGSIAATRRAR